MSIQSHFSADFEAVWFYRILKMSNQRNQQHFLSIGLIVVCLAGVIIAQTFTYSHGWTNGKKRASIIPFVFQDSSEGQEILGICQMQRLREILQGRHRDQAYLPCEVIGKSEDDIMDGLQRKRQFETNSILDSLPTQQN